MGFAGDGGVSGLPSFSEIAELNRLNEFARGIDSVLGELEEEFDAVKVLASAYGFDVSSYEARFRAGVAEVRDLASALLNAGTVEEKQRLYGDIQAKLRDLRSIIRGLRYTVESYNRRSLQGFKRGVDDAILTKDELRRIVATWFLKARSVFKRGLHRVIALVIPPKIYVLGNEMDNPNYVLVCSIADAQVDSVLGSVSVFIDWALSNDAFARVASILLKAIEESLEVWRAVITIVLYKFLQGVFALLTWLGKSVSWFLDNIAWILGIPSPLIGLLKDFIKGTLDSLVSSIGTALAYLENELNRAIQVFAESSIGKVLLYIKELLQRVLEDISVEFIIFVFKLSLLAVIVTGARWLARALGTFVNMLLSALSSLSPSAAAEAQMWIMMNGLFPFFFPSEDEKAEKKKGDFPDPSKYGLARENSMVLSWSDKDLHSFLDAVRRISQSVPEDKRVAVEDFLKATIGSDSIASLRIRFFDLYYILHLYDQAKAGDGAKIPLMNRLANMELEFDPPLQIGDQEISKITINDLLNIIKERAKRGEIDSTTMDRIGKKILEKAIQVVSLSEGNRYALDGMQVPKALAGEFIDRGAGPKNAKVLMRYIYFENENGILKIRKEKGMRKRAVFGLVFEWRTDGSFKIRVVTWRGIIALPIEFRWLTKFDGEIVEVSMYGYLLFRMNGFDDPEFFSKQELKENTFFLHDRFNGADFSDGKLLGIVLHPSPTKEYSSTSIKAINGVYNKQVGYTRYIDDWVEALEKRNKCLADLYADQIWKIKLAAEYILKYLAKISSITNEKATFAEAIYAILNKLAKYEENGKTAIMAITTDWLIANEITALYKALDIENEFTKNYEALLKEIMKETGYSEEELREALKEHISNDKKEVNGETAIAISENENFNGHKLMYALISAPHRTGNAKVPGIIKTIGVSHIILAQTHSLLIKKRYGDIKVGTSIELPPSKWIAFQKEIKDKKLREKLNKLYSGLIDPKEGGKVYHVLAYILAMGEDAIKRSLLLGINNDVVIVVLGDEDLLESEAWSNVKKEEKKKFARVFEKLAQIFKRILGVKEIKSANEAIKEEEKLSKEKLEEEEKRRKADKEFEKATGGSVKDAFKKFKDNAKNTALMAIIFAIIMNIGHRIGLYIMQIDETISKTIINTGTKIGRLRIGILTILALASWALLELDDIKDAYENIKKKTDGNFVNAVIMAFVGSMLAGIVIYGLIEDSPYAVNPRYALGYFVGALFPDLEWFFNEYLYDTIMYIIQIVAMGGIVNWLIGTIVGEIVSTALDEVLNACL